MWPIQLARINNKAILYLILMFAKFCRIQFANWLINRLLEFRDNDVKMKYKSINKNKVTCISVIFHNTLINNFILQ